MSEALQGIQIEPGLVQADSAALSEETTCLPKLSPEIKPFPLHNGTEY